MRKSINNSNKNTKVFPIELDTETHKLLKFMALESDVTLHHLILELLRSATSEYRGKFPLGKEEVSKD